MSVEFGILGPLELRADGRVLPLGGLKQRALLGLLLVHANEVVSRDRLIDEVWGERAPASVASELHVYLSRLRRLLEAGGAPEALVREAYGYRLRVEPEQLDANLFERLVDEGSQALAAGETDVAAGRLREALALWRGPPLADLQSERFAIAAGARLDEQRISALERRLEADLALGRAQELVAELETLVAEYPYREGPRAQLMLALYRSGRQAEALGLYQETRRTLAEELGLEPGQELKELEQAILRQDATLTPKRPVRAEPAPSLTPATAAAPPREERKVVTVLFADPVGFTAQAEPLDPEDVRAIQDRYWAPVRAEIERHGGTLEKFVGDAVMALFGAPRAHEDDPERAVRAALAIRDWAQDEGLEVRIAVTTGEALVRLGAKPLAGEGMAAGDVINTAARLQAAAPVNGILVGERTFRATKQAIAHREREPVKVKGKAAPLRVWEALGARSPVEAATTEQRRAPLVGRNRELGLLLATLTRVQAERAPELVTLVGVPGIGKTRLVDELRQLAAERCDAISWRQGRSLPYGDGISFWALTEIVKAQIGVRESDRDEQVEEKLTRAVETLLGEGREPEWVSRQLRPLVGIAGAGTEAGGDRDETFAAWRRFFEALAERQPLVLVFEDLHWADETLLDFVDGLAEWVSGVPLLVLATARPELLDRRPHWAGGKANAVTLLLPPLSDEESAQLLGALSKRLPRISEAQSVLLGKVGGNPFYAEQYARALEEGVETSDLPLPETVQGMIAARLDVLPPSEKSLLQEAAVLGKVFWSGVVAALQSVDRSVVDAQLRALECKQFLQHAPRSSVTDESEYAFCHLLLRDVAYAQIPRAARAAKHQAAAAWIEALGRPQDHGEALAHHYACALELTAAAGRDTAELADRARAALRAAGDRALSLNAAAAAANYYERALELWPEQDGERPQLLFRYASALHASGASGQEEMLTRASGALLAAGDPDTAAEAEVLLAGMWWLAGDRDAVERHLERAGALVQGRPASAAKAHVLAQLARLHVLTGQHEKAMQPGREALGIADTLRLPEIRAEALIYVGCARILTGDAAGVADLEHGLQLALAHNALVAASGGYTNLSGVMALKGDLVRGEQLLKETELLNQRLGNSQRLRLVRAYRVATTTYRRGEWDEALRFADEFIAECEAGAPHSQESVMRAVRATIRLARDDTDGALADCEKAVALAPHIGHPATALLAFGSAAAIYHELGRLDRAQTFVDEALACNPTLHAPGLVAWAGHLIPEGSLRLTWDADALGRRREVQAAVARLPSDSPWRQCAEFILEGRFDRAADAEIGAVAHEARARLRAAQTLTGQNRNDEAEAQLEKALVFYRSVGATRYIRQAEALLAAPRSAPKRDRSLVLPDADT